MPTHPQPAIAIQSQQQFSRVVQGVLGYPANGPDKPSRVLKTLREPGHALEGLGTRREPRIAKDNLQHLKSFPNEEEEERMPTRLSV